MLAESIHIGVGLTAADSAISLGEEREASTKLMQKNRRLVGPKAEQEGTKLATARVNFSVKLADE